MTDVHLPVPTIQQQKFIDSAKREQVYGGAKSGGKTYAGCMKATILSCMIPGNRGIIGRKHWPDLRDSTLETFRKVCPRELILDWRAQDKIFIIRTSQPDHPSTILFRALGDPDDFEKTKGLEVGWFWIDEPTEVPFDSYLMLLAQLRWTLPNNTRPPYMAMLTTNPEPGWVKRRFIDSMVPGGEFIPAFPRDNPHLPPDWEVQLRTTMHGEWVEKYLDGSWEVGEGSPFKELDSRIHVMENIDHTGMKLVGCIDHASTGVTCYLQCGVDKDDNLFVLECYYERDRLISQHAKAILSMMLKYGPQDYTLIDPSTESKTLQGSHELYSVQDEYRRNGVYTMAGRRANIEVGINLVGEMLHLSPARRHPRTQKPPSPRLFIQRSKCQDLWREMQDLRTELTPTGRIEYLGSDHAIDCLRYIMMSRPIAPGVDSTLPYEREDPFARIAFESFRKFDSKFGEGDQPNQWFRM